MRFFFHVMTDGGQIPDTEGQAFADLTDAVSEARQVARDLMADELRNGRSLPLQWYVQVVNERGATEAAVKFEDVALGGSAVNRVGEREQWLRRHREALESAYSGEPLSQSLGVLTRTVSTDLGEGLRAAFFVANDNRTTLRHVVGMPPSYAETFDGIAIGPGSLGCGLALHAGHPILTADVTLAPKWGDWRALAQKFDYRGWWSFPVLSWFGAGSFAIYSRQPRAAGPRDVEYASLITHTAAIILDRHFQRTGALPIA